MRLAAILPPLMSQENVDKTEAFIAAYNRRDFDAAVEFFDPEVDWVLPALQESDCCHGPDERVAVRLRYYGRGKGSGAELDTEMYHQVTTFRDGVIVRFEYFTSWPAALDAAGVEN